MKKFLFMSVLLGALMALTLTGCGSSSGSTRTYETQEAIPEVPNTGGDSIIVQNTGDGVAGMTYTKVSDGSVLVDCGPGGCGDVFAGNDITGDGDGSAVGGAGLAGTESTDCPAGTVWCSIESKCVPDSGSGDCATAH